MNVSGIAFPGVQSGDKQDFKIVTNKDIVAHRGRMYKHIRVHHQDRVDSVENSINSIINANQMLNGSNASKNLENIENNSNPGKQ